ncbi:substrate-binding domain-containing protein [Williamsia sp.]|uniref:substrate-binding domain-containing protein n=1 Tax=Williamsia sp. TaxID=1872085 RepID=UPI001A300403|nr:substrate-binding domain-containing protein [Williamsia sp.]MBJ7287315.1 substrate-binding domain-containing protein [Williamsia sp.]
MGQHRTDDTRRRGISRGVVFGFLAIVVVAVLVVVWISLGNRITADGDDAAKACVEGPATVTVLADPALATQLNTIAGAYNATKPVVRDQCITVTVAPQDAKVTLDGLTGTWDTESMGPYPAAWVPASSVWSAQLLTARSAVVDGNPESLVTSPVVLAVAPELARAAGSTVGWLDIPTLARRDNSLDDLGLRGWGSLKMALAAGPGSDASVLAAEAIATQVSRTTTGGLTAADADTATVTSTLTDLRKRAPTPTDGVATGALPTIANSGNPATASIHAIPITEQALYAATRSDTSPGVIELLPEGPTPLADYPVVDLTGQQVTAAQAEAVTRFFDFVRTPEQLTSITALGFRGNAPLPAATAAVTFPVTDNPMPAPEPAAATAIAKIILGG